MKRFHQIKFVRVSSIDFRDGQAFVEEPKADEYDKETDKYIVGGWNLIGVDMNNFVPDTEYVIVKFSRRITRKGVQ